MDRGQRETEAILKQIEKRINQEYKQAIDEIEDQLSDYLRRFEIKDKKWQEWVESGYKTEDQYKKWRMQQMAVGEKWSEQKEQIAYELAHVNETAKGLAKMAAPEIFAENANYSTFKIEKDAKIDTGFTLYSRESVAELIANDPEVLPPVGKKVARDIAMGKAVKWNRQQLQSVMMQGILQGDSIPKLATRLANTVGDRDRKAAIRNARTMATAAQNAGREQSYKNAQAKGIELEQMWIATLDNRTRHSHRWLDGERKPVGEPFSNGCRYPADPEGAPAEIYNCRCTLRAVVKGLERRSGQFRDTSAMDDMTYDQWRDAKATSNPITLPEEKGKAIKQSFIREYGGFGAGNSRKITEPELVYEVVTTRKDAIESLKKTFTDVEGLSRLDENLLVETTNRFNELNAKYNAVIANNGSYLHTTTKTKAIAYVSGGYRDDQVELVLNSRFYREPSWMYDNEARSQKTFFSMPCDEKQYNIYTITHEYGHLLEAKIERLRTNWEELEKKAEKIAGPDASKIKIVNEHFRLVKAEEKEKARTIRKEIIDIAKTENKDFDLEKSLSKYGHTNDHEFFAEVFANAHCGKPNELGKAMQKWLKKEGY